MLVFKSSTQSSYLIYLLGDNINELLGRALELDEGLADNRAQAVLDKSILLGDQSIGDLGDIGDEKIAWGEDLNSLVEREDGEGSERFGSVAEDREEAFSLGQDLCTISGIASECGDCCGHSLGGLGDGGQGIDEWLNIALLESWRGDGAAQEHAEGENLSELHFNCWKEWVC